PRTQHPPPGMGLDSGRFADRGPVRELLARSVAGRTVRDWHLVGIRRLPATTELVGGVRRRGRDSRAVRLAADADRSESAAATSLKSPRAGVYRAPSRARRRGAGGDQAAFPARRR